MVQEYSSCEVAISFRDNDRGGVVPAFPMLDSKRRSAIIAAAGVETK